MHARAGLLALGHLHGVATKTKPSQPDDLALAKDLMRTCYELYRRAGVTPYPAGCHGMHCLLFEHSFQLFQSVFKVTWSSGIVL